MPQTCPKPIPDAYPISVQNLAQTCPKPSITLTQLPLSCPDYRKSKHVAQNSSNLLLLTWPNSCLASVFYQFRYLGAPSLAKLLNFAPRPWRSCWGRPRARLWVGPRARPQKTKNIISLIAPGGPAPRTPLTMGLPASGPAAKTPSKDINWVPRAGWPGV